jgi:hypothetical protein
VSRAILLAGVLVALAGPASARALNPEVIPFPGTPDASPTSQIIFPSLSLSQIRALQVVGSRSGAHSGELFTLPDGAGTAFKPRRSFVAGERVSVSAIGGPGGAGIHDRFTVARPAPRATGARSARVRAPQARSEGPELRFHSQPGLHPPAVGVTGDPDQRSGDIFLTPTGQVQEGPMILSPRGQLVWFEPLTGTTAAINLQVQRYRGDPVLTWFRGAAMSGADVIMNRSYRTVATVRAGDGYSADEHEFSITPQGTAWLDAYVPVRANLSRVGGPADGSAFDCVVQEIDIRTGRVLWEWHSLGHIPVTKSYASYRTSNILGTYDYFHLNSIQQLPGGNLLISARNTWAVYKISRRTGRVIWTLGGKHSSFAMGPGTNFEWQHDARLTPGGLLSVFDDAASPPEEPQSSGKIIRIHQRTMRVTLVHRYIHSPPVTSGSQGSVQTLADGNVFVGWGSDPDFSEYTPGGKQIFNGNFALGVKSYRAFRFPWVGQPLTPPALAVSSSSHGVTVYASWNGATRVRAWRVLGGARPNALKQVARAARTGFETAITVESSRRYFAVQALGSTGDVLGTSATRAR